MSPTAYMFYYFCRHPNLLVCSLYKTFCLQTVQRLQQFLHYTKCLKKRNHHNIEKKSTSEELIDNSSNLIPFFELLFIKCSCKSKVSFERWFSLYLSLYLFQWPRKSSPTSRHCSFSWWYLLQTLMDSLFSLMPFYTSCFTIVVPLGLLTLKGPILNLLNALYVFHIFWMVVAATITCIYF